jgi:hypothetical protein
MNGNEGSSKMTLETNKRRGIGALIAIGMISGFGAFAVPPPTGTAPVLIPAGGFRIEGDLMAAAAGGDWVGGTNVAAGVLNAAGVPLNPATTFHFVDPFNSTADNAFVGGLKWSDDPNTWQWTTGKPSSKTDINNVLLHIAADADGHTWSVVAADRASTSGVLLSPAAEKSLISWLIAGCQMALADMPTSM